MQSNNKRTGSPTTIPTKRQCILSLAAHQAADKTDEMAYIAEILEQVQKTPLPADSLQGLLVIARTVRQTMLEINALQEHNRERRHQELMQLLDSHLHATPEGVGHQEVSIVKANIKSEQVESGYTENFEDIIQEAADEDDTKGRETPMKTIKTETVTGLNKINAPSEQTQHQREFQAMRKRMLELQRKKMEDRERKQKIKLEH